MSLKDDLIRDEGLKLQAYKDTAVPPNWTIGVGHLLGPTPRMSEITGREAMALLDADIEDAAALAAKLVGLDYDEVRWRAVVNMAFNLGNRLETFVNFLAAYKAKDWPRAASEMMRSVWAVQVGDRAIRLHDMILNGVA